MTMLRTAAVVLAAAPVLAIAPAASAAPVAQSVLQTATAYLAGDGVLVDVGGYSGTGFDVASAEVFAAGRECFTSSPEGLSMTPGSTSARVSGVTTLTCSDPSGGPDVDAVVTVDLSWTAPSGTQTRHGASPQLKCVTTSVEAAPAVVTGQVRVSIPAVGLDQVLTPSPDQLVRLAWETSRCAQPGRP